MSESAAEDTIDVTDTGTDVVEPGTGEDAEDFEAEGLLAGMAENDPEALQREIAHWKKMSRQHESRSKANAAAAAELKQIKQAGMSELERAQTAQREAEERAATAENLHFRVMAAAAHSLPPELIDHLGSGTEDEINERAELFSQVIQATAQELAEQILSRNGINTNGLGTGRPLESLRPGSAPATGAAPVSREEWFRRLVTGQ